MTAVDKRPYVALYFSVRTSSILQWPTCISHTHINECVNEWNTCTNVLLFLKKLNHTSVYWLAMHRLLPTDLPFHVIRNCDAPYSTQTTLPEALWHYIIWIVTLSVNETTFTVEMWTQVYNSRLSCLESSVFISFYSNYSDPQLNFKFKRHSLRGWNTIGKNSW